jgi:acetylornithine deacetylase
MRMELPQRTVDVVNDAVEQRRSRLVELCADLVRIPSETHPPGGDEGPVQRYIDQVFTDLGLEVDVFEPWSVPGIQEHPGWWPGLEYDDRPNVVGRWHGSGGGRDLILNGHCDVVPAGPAALWTHPPYDAVIADGKIHGRGSSDQKAGIAAMTMAVAVLRDLALQLRGDVILQSVVNEELGGYNGTLACCEKGYRADAAIITEPSGLAVAPAAKGGQTYEVTVPGRNAHHAWWWEGKSAFDGAIAVKRALERWEQLREDELAGIPLFSDKRHYPKPALADTIWHVEAGDAHIMASPSSARLAFWVDVLPGEDREEVLKRFEQHVLQETAADPFWREHPVTLERALMRPFTGVSVPLDHPVIGSLQRSHTAAHGSAPDVVGMGGATDAMIFNLYSDTPAVVYGPGDLGVAHSPDEYVEIEELVDATKTLALTILDFCGLGDAAGATPATRSREAG